MYLLKRYLFPDDFLTLDLDKESEAIIAISRNQYNRQTLLDLREAATHTIGIPKCKDERTAERLSIGSWIALIESISSQMDAVFTELNKLADQLPEYDLLRSLKGISDITAALFLGEVRNIHRFAHYKQLEKSAGYNLRLSQSGQYVGTRHISHIGNRRLAWLLYTMTEETAKWVPEVRAKYLRRQIKRRRHRKNVVASTPQLLKIIMALIKEGRRYELRQDKLSEMRKLEAQYAEIKQQSKRTKLSRNKTTVASHAT